ncbi:hypothetical protein [Mycolicibacterium sp.]|uniref:hypothetical protein n=1 Tax=Mycolicibacterium sp. TaxID=2320850 RepID=UPI003D0DCE8C
MTAQTFPAAPDSEGRHRHRLVVAATAAGELVETIGGFLCDRASAGWDVSVVSDGACDVRALTILGITAQHGCADVAAVLAGIPCGGTVAVSADLLVRDARVRAAVARLADDARTDVAVFGTAPAGLGAAQAVVHSPSLAARAFKRYALLAVDRNRGDAGPTETFYRWSGAAARRLYAV